jgi:hypothetical protein
MLFKSFNEPQNNRSECSMLPSIAVLTVYIGGFFALAAISTGTCTMNDAGQLVILVLSIPFYAIAAVCLAKTRSPRNVLIAYIISSPVLVWQAGFAGKLSVQILAYGASACEVLRGGPYGLDGKEDFYVTLWLVVGLGLPLIMTVILWRRFPLALSRPLR